MQDPRALANPRNLQSYRAWGEEGAQRSGFLAIVYVLTLLTPMLSMGGLIFRPWQRDHALLLPTVVAFGLYLAVALGLMLFAVLRLNAWKRAHPWEPPPSPAWK